MAHKITKWKILLTGIFMLMFAQHSFILNGQTHLNELIDFALEHSHDVKNAQLKVEESDYQRKEALGQGLPQIEASASYSAMTFPEMSISDDLISQIPEEYAPMLSQLLDFDAYYMASAGVQVTQLLYSNAYWTGLKTTKKYQELNELLKYKTEEELIEEVAKDYYQTVSLVLRLNTLNESLDNLSELYHIVDLNYKNDLVKESEASRLKVNITNLEVNRQIVKNAINIQLNLIKAIAGMPPDTVLALDTAFLYQANEYIQIPDYSINNVSDFKILLKQDELNEQNIKAAKANYVPTLAAYAKFDYNGYNTEYNIDDFSNYNTYGVQLNIPIFTSGVNHAKVKQARLKQVQTQETLLKTQDLLTIDYNNAYSVYQTAYVLLQVQKENLDLAERVYNQTSLQFKEGMASMADVLNVNSDFLDANNSYSQQILKCKLAEITLLKTTGNLKQLTSK